MAWYDNSQILSYNRVFNFVIGNRGGGKTFNAKRWMINDYLKNGKHFVYVRRYKNELKNIHNFFKAIEHNYPEHKFEVKGKIAYCDGKEFGTFITLSCSHNEKSKEFPLVNKVIYDEFIIDKSATRYINNEPEVFMELFETIARMRDDVRALFLGNAISVVNPYFVYWKIRPDLSKRFNKYEHICVEFFADADYIKEKSRTRFGQLALETSYGDYSINNNFLRDSDTFIKDKSLSASFYCCFKYQKVIYGVWIDYNEGLLYVNRQYDPYRKSRMFAITKEDHSPNTILIDNIKRHPSIRVIKSEFERGNVRFSDITVKNQFYDIMYLFM